MVLTIQERLKDLRMERGLTLGQLAAQAGLSTSAPGGCETKAGICRRKHNHDKEIRFLLARNGMMRRFEKR